MSTILIASGTTLANSADFTLTSGESANLFLVDDAGPDVSFSASALVQIKETVGGEYYTVGRMDNNTPAATLMGPGTFRVRRLASASSVGVARG
jgi:hypothetical protein